MHGVALMPALNGSLALLDRQRQKRTPMMLAQVMLSAIAVACSSTTSARAIHSTPATRGTPEQVHRLESTTAPDPGGMRYAMSGSDYVPEVMAGWVNLGFTLNPGYPTPGSTSQIADTAIDICISLECNMPAMMTLSTLWCKIET